jgi:esterase FrsA
MVKQLFTSLCMITGQTERAANRLGVRFFLPQLFLLRYANLGGLDPEVFGGQLDNLKSFEETEWCGYWNAFAADYERQAEEKGGQAQDLLIKAITYYSISAFPGHTPLRMEAYWKARELSDRLMPMLDERMEKVTLDIRGERVDGYLRFPRDEGRFPLVIVTNGLEGTMQEIGLPLVAYKGADIGVFLMEMPGTYSYSQPMSGASEEIYSRVIDHFTEHPQVDADNIAMIGLSFGAYWAARMAAASDKLKCSVVCGAPLHHTFSVSGSIGVPQIIIEILMKLTGARNVLDLRSKLSALSFERNDLYRRIHIPLLIINGDNDTLCGTKDSVVLDTKVPKAFLKLYENDDHCAMGHYREWLDLTFGWLKQQFAVKEPA